MNVFTDKEAYEFEVRNAGSTGLQFGESNEIFYDDVDASCLALTYPETPLRVTYASRLLAMLGVDEDESNFHGALLWLRLWNIGSPQLEKSGWKMVERMRMGFGELRPLGDASAHWFRSDEVAELAAFIVPCFVYGWDAYVLPASAACFAFISHDAFWCLAARNAETGSRLLKEFSDFNPQSDERLTQRFCRR